MQRLLFGRLIAKIEQLRTELTDKVSTLEHSIVGERDQLRAELTNRMQTLEQTLIGEIQRLQIPSEFSQLSKTLEQLQEQVQALSSLALQLSSIPEKLEQLQEQVHTLSSLVSQPSSIPEKLEKLQEQVQALSLLISQFSPVLPSGEQKSVDELIKARMQLVLEALQALENEYTSLLAQHDRTLQESHDHEIEKARIETRQNVLKEAEHGIHQALNHLLSPSEAQADSPTSVPREYPNAEKDQ